ncbi:MAG: CinA family protein [Spirochaetales bacterium]
MSRSEVDEAAREALAARVLEIALDTHLCVCTAESCTGGLLGAALTAIAGSSRSFVGGLVAYSNEIKRDLLGVRAETLERDGAVSEACVIEMATAAAALFGAEVAVSVSGIAGPGGGTPEKPVGTVWIGISSRGEVSAYHHLFTGDRRSVRIASVDAALRHVIEKLELG